jgi:putative NADH-flavin reductase
MKLLIFGASGLTGREMVKQALEQNYDVTAFVRTPEKFNIKHDNLKVASGDITNYESVERAVEGQEAAVSALGASSLLTRNPSLTEGVRNIVQAMEKNGVRRFVYESALGVGDSAADTNFLVRYFVLPVILGRSNADHEDDERIIKASNLDWIIVRPTMLGNQPRTGKYKTGVHIAGSFPVGKIGRADVADFMLKQVVEDRFLHLTPSILY